MKILVTLLMIAAFTYLGYRYGWPYIQKWIKPDEANLVEEPPPRLAPDGVFFIIEQFSHVTEEGIIALHPGTKVTVVNDFGSTLKVSDGVQEFEVPREKLSNDLDVRDSAIKGDRAIQARFQTALKELDAASVERIKGEIADAKLKIEKLNLQRDEALTIRGRFVREFQDKYNVSHDQLKDDGNAEQRKRINDITLLDANINRLNDEIEDIGILIKRKSMEIRK